ncbi:alpha-galactosidase [Agromyces silvae]|uniref:alpha-galactosidase n=1 Tax=Agromyces silvae TaxID=3388266 RepID=UPI00280A7728|nr:alpha-galactosidase [Agromyces protaetiae]
MSVAEPAGASESPRTWSPIVRLAAAGSSIVVALPEDGLPRVLHWGPDTGQLSEADFAALVQATTRPNAANGIDVDTSPAILPEAWTGWTGTPGISGHRDGRDWSPRFRTTAVTVTQEWNGGGIEVEARDAITDLGLTLVIEMLPSGLVRARASVRNEGSDAYRVDGLTLMLPVPTRADELLDMAGRWSKERVPQRGTFRVGTYTREGRHGRTGADAATLLTAGTTGLDFGSGEAWGVHVAFSGNHRTVAERIFTGERLIGGGELLLPGEVVLRPGESYTSPYLWGAYGRDGLDDVAARFHRHLRARAGHPRSPRPVTMNVWEAVYFDHDLDRLLELADLAASVGVERFVLDDGWFGDRRNDTAGLGDWAISDAVWGDGRFRRLVDHVKALGMEFGLWFEPEMVNLDSDLARSHPEWLLQVPGRLPVEFRHQQVLDIAQPDAYAHVLRSIVSLVTEYGIDFIKWDHNRDLVDAGSTVTGRAGVHEQTLAAYRLLDEIRAACPGLEIESCSSGGARVDLEILEHTDRVWASDCIDAHERQQIQRWTSQLVPLELIGSHIGAEKSHTTGRKLPLSFRGGTAVLGHFGVEWDLTEATAEQRFELADWVSFYKAQRALIHTGTLIRRDLEAGALWLTGVVAPDQSAGLFAIAFMERPVTWPAGRVLLPGLSPEASYVVTPAGPADGDAGNPKIYPEWWRNGSVTLTGATLATVGLDVPALHPDRAAWIAVEREPQTLAEGSGS